MSARLFSSGGLSNAGCLFDLPDLEPSACRSGYFPFIPPCASECASLTRLFTERQTAGMGSVPAYEQSVLACPGVLPGTGAAKVSCDNGWRFARKCEALTRHLWDLM